MSTFHESMVEYKRQLEKGYIQQAYKGLMDYMLALKTHFKNNYPDYAVSGSIYFGYMDMTYFAVVPSALKPRSLKIAVVFLHEACRFEVWLSAANKQVQGKYWNLARQSGWEQYRLVPSIQGADSIVEHTLVAAPDFSDLDALTRRIERETLAFVRGVEAFLAQHED